MSILVSVAISVAEDSTTYVQVLRGETVLPVEPSRGLSRENIDVEGGVDLIDLCRAALSRLVAEAADVADSQVVDFRELIGKLGE